MDVFSIKRGKAELSVVPQQGAAISSLTYDGQPILREWNGGKSPFDFAQNVLFPFSNRISNGGFTYAGKFYEVEPNLAGEACPIHGCGFMLPWDAVIEGSKVVAELKRASIGPFLCNAKQIFELLDTSLFVSTELTNVGDFALPFGFGFHPWIPRDKDTRIKFHSERMWLEDDEYLPTELIDVTASKFGDFETLCSLPDQWINNAFVGWDGIAEIMQGPLYRSFKITASENLNTVIVYSPSSDSSFFCFEPVSHPVDALNHDQSSLEILEPGKSMKCWIKYQWDA